MMEPLAAPAPAPFPSIEVEEALNGGWLEDWYQPKIDLKRKCLAGAEALTCVRHPGLGLLMPDGYTCGTSNMARLSEHVLLAMHVGGSARVAVGHQQAEA